LEEDQMDLCDVESLMLDLSAAFDTIDNAKLLHRLQNMFHMSGVPLKWIASYLGSRTFSVKIREILSSQFPLEQDVPQGSILGPVLLIIYIDDTSSIGRRHGVHVHIDVNNTAFHIGFTLAVEFSKIRDRIRLRLEEVKLLMIKPFLEFKLEKKRILFCKKPPMIDLYGNRFQRYEEVYRVPIKGN